MLLEVQSYQMSKLRKSDTDIILKEENKLYKLSKFDMKISKMMLINDFENDQA